MSLAALAAVLAALLAGPALAVPLAMLIGAIIRRMGE